MKAALAAAAVAMGLSVVCTPALGQSLVDAAKRAEDSRKANTATPITFDQRDVDPRYAAHEILAYGITDERWQQFLAANKVLDKVMAKDAALKDRYLMLRPTSARMIERFIVREPPLAKSLESTGMTPHDYAYTAVAVGVALAIIASNPGPAVYDQLPDATKANVAFVRAHEAEIKELFVYAREKAAERSQK